MKSYLLAASQRAPQGMSDKLKKLLLHGTILPSAFFRRSL